MTSFLFVCLGNICRSPAAEAIFHKKIENQRPSKEVNYQSAGTIDHHKGEPADPRMISALKRYGYQPISTSRPVENQDFYKFNYIFAMDQNNLKELHNRRPKDSHSKIYLICDFIEKTSEQEVPDPYYGGSEGFDKVIKLLEAAIDGVIDNYLQP